MSSPNVAEDKAARRARLATDRLREARLELPEIDTASYATEGLTQGEVDVRVQLRLTNAVSSSSSRSIVSILRANLFTLFNAVVGGSFIILLILGQWRDAIFGVIVIANIGIGVVQEFRSKRTLDRLALISAPLARVRRDGTTLEVATDQVVLDELLVLRTGDQVPADATIVSSEGLDLDESLLTGESDPVLKNVGDEVLSGSSVVAGFGLARVTLVGPESYASRITLEAKRFSLVSSELRNALARLIKWISWALIPLVIIVTNGQMQNVGGWQAAWESGLWLEATVRSVASIISMIPQGLVLITSIAFAVAAVKLARRQVLVQELPAVEGLARVDVVCFDKTGTLTEGSIEFNDVHSLVPESEAHSWSRALAWFGADENANATALALAQHFSAHAPVTAVASTPFSSARKWSAVQDDAQTTWILGAPEMVLESGADDVRDLCRERAELGLRTLVLASSPGTIKDEQLPKKIRAVAILTFGEKVRGDARETIEYFLSQGLKLKVISGDNPRTVAAVARTAGLTFDGHGFDARELPEDLDELASVLQSHDIFGRVTPEQKKLMVIALQSRGHVVAMTGDGVNDALALKRADLGIAMGSGSAATKAVSRLVLLDGSFSSLPGVVAEGRRVIANVERVSRLFLTKTAWAMVLAIVFGVMLWAFPFLPRQLSANDLFTIGLPAFALALLPNARRYQPGFLKRALSFCIPTGVLIGALVVGLDAVQKSFQTFTVAQTQTSVSMFLALAGMWVLVTLSRPFNRWRFLIVAAMYLGFAVVFLVPASQDFFGFVWLDGSLLWVTLAFGFVGVLAIEFTDRIVQRIMFGPRKHWGPERTSRH
ncbi:MAG: cation-translocating P-type ATPase [Aurantimicrobium sp.]|nr:cation-translocating P-type ATPase [Aurantimicrobium sp.]